MNESLITSGKYIETQNGYIHDALLEELNDFPTQYKAKLWQPKANRVKSLSSDSRKYIDSLIAELNNGKTIETMFSGGKAIAIFQKFLACRNGMLDVLQPGDFPDKAIVFNDVKNAKEQLIKRIPLLQGVIDGQKWLESSFSGNQQQLTVLILNKLRNDILLSENMLIQYCNSHVTNYTCGHRQFESIAILNSSYVKTGQLIEVKAGIGSFTKALLPRVTIDGKPQSLNSNGVAVYSFIAKGSPGKHFVNVRFEFTDSNGKKAVKEDRVEYVIAQ